MGEQAGGNFLGRDPADAAVSERLSNAYSLRVALNSLPLLFDNAYIMRITLEPQRQVTHQLVHLTSKQWEVKQKCSPIDSALYEFRGFCCTKGRCSQTSSPRHGLC